MANLYEVRDALASLKQAMRGTPASSQQHVVRDHCKALIDNDIASEAIIREALVILWIPDGFTD